MQRSEKITVSAVKIKPLPQAENGELSEEIFQKCGFCGKNCRINTLRRRLLEPLAGPGEFYCEFCLRHNFHTRNNRHVLILSFRSIAAFFYQNWYVRLPHTGRRQMWFSEIEDCVESHVQAGLQNPLFVYDPETMLWFVDFSRVGNSKRKIPLDEILKTVINILACFNLHRIGPDVDMVGFFGNYKTAIETFYQKRYRPENRRMLIPTLTGSAGIAAKELSAEKQRNFILRDAKHQ